MSESIQVGDRVRVRFDSKFWQSAGWLTGTVVKIEPYSAHRHFYWVALDQDATARQGGGTKLIAVLNPKNIQKWSEPGIAPTDE